MAPKRKASEPAERASRGRVRIEQNHNVPRVRETRAQARAIQQLIRDQPSTSSGAPRMPVRRNNIVRGRGAGRGRGSSRGRGRGRQNVPARTEETDTDAISVNAPEDELREEMDGSASAIIDELSADEHQPGMSNEAEPTPPVPGSDRRDTTGIMPNSAPNQPPRAVAGDERRDERADFQRVADGGAGNRMRGIAGENLAINNYQNDVRVTPGGINYLFSANPSASNTVSSCNQSAIPIAFPLSSNHNEIATDTDSTIIPHRQALSSICSPLGDCIPNSIREKIIKGEFVEFGLLVDKAESRSNSVSEAPTLGVNAQGQLIMMNEAKSQNKITSIHSWTSAFLVYTAVYLSAHPHRTQELLKYGHVIRLAASRCGAFGWRSYDEQFRYKMQRYPQNSWAAMDGELWNMYIAVPSQFLPSNKGGRGGAQGNFRGFGRGQRGGQRRNGGSAPAGICYAFNGTSGCQYNPCIFKHVCQKCRGGGHGASTCTRGAKK